MRLKLSVIPSNLFFALRAKKDCRGTWVFAGARLVPMGGKNPGPSACPHRASAARDGVRDDRSFAALRSQRSAFSIQHWPSALSCQPSAMRLKPSVIPSNLFFALRAKKDCRGTWVFAGARLVPMGGKNPGPSACPHRASAARDGARDDRSFSALRSQQSLIRRAGFES